MVAKKAYPLRINEEILSAMQRWSDDELRSLNAQIEYVLRDALRKSGRTKPKPIETIIDPKN
ncbi:Arc family DNA binding domain-containing protein [Colwellia sp. MB3u-55]|nr:MULTISPECIES: Arc family DNA binding domain-containing protein [unclassified Colwellia]MBA6251913.1 Arc family DNA binding domain-containing protein [Colwellia sp. MB3u-55]MBA6399405.1 Arc family DNA binding domain-containing protein [Colwellia sp. BRX10-4]